MGDAADDMFDHELETGRIHRHYGPNYKPWRMKKREWQVIDHQDRGHIVKAHYCFNNGAEGLVFRTYPPKSDRTVVVATFAQGVWRLFKEI